jgi:hypothetical protein
MPSPISTYPGFLGLAKETTAGTPVAAAVFVPVTELSSEDVRNYVPDQAMRGSAVDTYNQVATQGWGTLSCGGPAFLDTIGYILKGILGAEDISGAGPYVHVLSVLNSGTYQPPTYTLYDYNGYEARRFPYGMWNSCQLSYGADALLTHSSQAMAQASTGVAKPTQSFSAVPATAAYKTVVTVGGSASTLVTSAQITIARPTNPIIALNASTSPTAIWGTSVAVSGQLVALYEDDAFLTPMLNGTATSVELSLTDTSSNILDIKATSGLFTQANIARNSNGYMEITVPFSGTANTTDANTAGGGYSPAKVTITNSVSTVF